MKKTNKNGVYYSIRKDKILLVDSKQGKWIVNDILDNELNTVNYILNSDFVYDQSDIEKPCFDKFNLFIVDTTILCNLRCTYCSVDATSKGKTLTPENFVIAFNHFLSLPNISEFLTIEFSGGEPLINFDFIKLIVPKIILLSNKKNISVRFAIQTNGTLINSEIANFFKFHNFSVGISIDGYRKWNRNRLFEDGKEAYDKIMRGIYLLRDSEVAFSVLGVISNPKQYNDYLDFATQNHIHSFRLNTLTNIGRSLKAHNRRDSVANIYELYAQEYIKLAKKLILEPQFNSYKEANLTYFLWSLLEWQPHMCFRNPCGAGRNQLHLTAYGEFFPCQDWRSINDAKICDISTMHKPLKYYIDNHKRCIELSLSNNTNYAEMCENCSWIAYCGTCPREIFTEKKSNEPIGLCKFNNMIYEELCWLISSHPHEVFKYLGIE